jgi:hypothetical protein
MNSSDSGQSNPPDEAILDLFVDEAGDPTLFANRRRAIVDTDGCSRFFILGKLEVSDPAGLSARLTELRERLLHHPYFSGVPSFDPARGKTAIAFHAKDDLPEVRFLVFDLLAAEADNLRFHAVVCDKEAILERVQQRNQTDADYWYRPNELYDDLMRSLFGKFHRLADRYRVCVARRGARDRTEALRRAIEHAEQDFEVRFGFGRGGMDAWEIRVSTPENDVPLQAVDYFMWAVQRFYEPRVDKGTGALLRDDRFLKLLWPQIGEIHDLHFGPTYGTYFTATQPLDLKERFPPPKTKKS